MRWLITGGAGMLGTDLAAELEARDIEYVALGSKELDVTDAEAIAELITDVRPDVVANCAAYTAVDAAEEDEPSAFAVNAVAPQLLAHAANEVGATFIQFSTDYVFGGDAETPYEVDEPLNPLGAYGRTKAAGEWAAAKENRQTYIVRTAWLYGASGPCFPKTMAQLLQKHGTVNVVSDQFGQPTWTKDLARLTVDLVTSDAPFGIYHGTASGETSWAGFTKEIAKNLGMSKDSVKPVSSEEFVRPAPRPSYSVLSHDQFQDTDVEPIGNWLTRWEVAAPEVLASTAPN